MDKVITFRAFSGKKIIAISAVIMVFSITAAVTCWKVILGIWPGEATILHETASLEKMHRELEKEIREIHEGRRIRALFLGRGGNYWLPKRDGDIEGSIVRKIEEVAGASGLKMQNMGNARLAKLNDDISVMEVNLEAKSSMEDIARFMTELHKAEPRYGWRKCVLRPANQNDSKEMVLSGTLGVICLTGDAAAKAFCGERK